MKYFKDLAQPIKNYSLRTIKALWLLIIYMLLCVASAALYLLMILVAPLCYVVDHVSEYAKKHDRELTNN